MLGDWIQVLTNGAASGLVLALLSSAFAVVYIPTNKFHVGLCAILVLVPAVAYELLEIGLGWFPVSMIAVATGAGVSWLDGILNHERLDRRRASSGAHLISGLGVYLVLSQLLILAAGSESRMLHRALDDTYHLGPTILTSSQLLGAVVSILMLTALVALVRWTHVGVRLRALSNNPAECELRGIDVGLVRAVAFAVAGGLGAASGLLSAREHGFDPNGGLLAGLPAIVALVIGGRQSFLGPILGALLIGLIRSAAVWCFSAGWQEPATFLVLAVFLLFRPNGLIQHPEGLEAR